MRSHECSSSYYQEQFRQPFEDELFLSLKEEIKKDKEALEMRWPNKETDMEANMETKMDTKMIADMVTNSTNLSREMYAIVERTTIQAKELAKILKEQSSR